MLFYNDKDEICLKYEDGTFKTIREYEYFEMDGKWFNYSNGYFYDAVECDGDLETYWDRQTHPRHMGILEMEDAFAPPSYNCVIDNVFKYKEGITSDQHLVMYLLSSRVMDEYVKSHESAYYSVSRSEYELIGGEDFLRELGELVLDDYIYYYDVYEEENRDKAYIQVIWSYE